MATRPMRGTLTDQGKLASFENRQRERIKTGKIISKLQSHVLGDTEMSQTQIMAARLLLSRTVPELKAIEISTNGNGIKDVLTIPTHALLDAIEGQSKRIK